MENLVTIIAGGVFGLALLAALFYSMHTSKKMMTSGSKKRMVNVANEDIELEYDELTYLTKNVKQELETLNSNIEKKEYTQATLASTRLNESMRILTRRSNNYWDTMILLWESMRLNVTDKGKGEGKIISSGSLRLKTGIRKKEEEK